MTQTRKAMIARTDDIWHWFMSWGEAHHCKGYKGRITVQAILEEMRRRDDTVSAILAELDQYNKEPT